TLSNEAGTVLAQNDDRPDTVDPGFDYTVPKGVSALIVALKDLQGNGGPNYVYRIAITPADQPDFGLSVFEDRHNLPQGGSTAIRVRANRAGYNGPIRLSMLGLPKGVVVTGDEIPAGATDTLLSLSASGDVSLAQGPLAIFGESVSAQSPIRRVAQVPETSIYKNQPWLRSDLAFAVTQPAPIAIAWDTDALALPIGDSYGAKVRVNRAGPTTGPIRLSLI